MVDGHKQIGSVKVASYELDAFHHPIFLEGIVNGQELPGRIIR